MIVHLKKQLKEDIENIDATSMAHLSAEIVISETSRCVGLTKNCAKGSGDMFKAHVEDNHPRYLLFHVNDVAGSR